MKHNAPQARFWEETKCATRKTYRTKCAADPCFGTKNPDALSVLLTWCVIHFPQFTVQHLISLRMFFAFCVCVCALDNDLLL